MINLRWSNCSYFIYEIITVAAFALFSTTATALTEPPETNAVISVLNSDTQYQKTAPRFHLFKSLQTSATKLSPLESHPYLSVMAGTGTSNKIGKQQLDTTPGINNGYWQYLSDSNYYTTIVCGLNGGYEFKLKTDILLSLGLGIYQNLNYHSNGQVWYVYLSPVQPQTTHEFNYEYKVLNTRLMLETQLAWPFCINNTRLIPFILLGIGPSLNLANSYQQKVVNSETNWQLLPDFRTKSTISFAYQLGLGMAYPFNSDRSRLFIAYRYVDLGHAYFTGREDYLYQLDTGRIRANEVYLGYTHLFNF